MAPLNRNGAVFYRGPSMIDGAPIIGVATGFRVESDNGKTGDMIQTWIMPESVEPPTAARNGADRSVCGDCSHAYRPDDDDDDTRTCYVDVGKAPLAVHRCASRGGYPDYATCGSDYALSSAIIGADMDVHAPDGWKLRMGSWGDPAAIPADVWAHAVDTIVVSGWTGYTHQWNAPRGSILRRNVDRLRPYVMASVESEREARRAQRRGWRTFRVGRGLDDMAENETLCPASEEARHRTTCADCTLCAGFGRFGIRRSARSIFIPAHGAQAASIRWEV